MKHLKKINEEWINEAAAFKDFEDEYQFITKNLKTALAPNKIKFDVFGWHSPMSHIEGTYTDNLYFDMTIPKSKHIDKVQSEIGGVVLNTNDLSYISLISEAIKSVDVLSQFKSVIQFNKDKNNIIRVIFYRKGKYKIS